MIVLVSNSFRYSRSIFGALLLLSFFLSSPCLAEDGVLASPIGTSLKSALSAAFNEPAAPEPKPSFELQSGLLEMNDLTGAPLMSAKPGSKRTVLYFWSVYCRSCVPGVRKLEEMREAFASNDIELMTVHLFETDINKFFARFARLGLSVPVFLAPDAVRDLFSIRLLPTTLVFDGNRRLISRVDGKLDSEGLRLELMGLRSSDQLPTEQPRATNTEQDNPSSF